MNWEIESNFSNSTSAVEMISFLVVKEEENFFFPLEDLDIVTLLGSLSVPYS